MSNFFVHGTDAGLDDLCVVSAYLRKGHIPLAQVSSFGCTSLIQATQNICDVNGMYAVDIPVYRGRETSFSFPEEGALPTFFGDNGLNNCFLPSSDSITVEFSPLSLIEQIGDLQFDWLETGPMSNLAYLAMTKPAIFDRQIRNVYAMGGAFRVPGLVGTIDSSTKLPVAEFNWFHDPLAVRSVLKLLNERGQKMKVIAWDECLKLRLMKRRIESLSAKDAKAQYLLTATREFFSLYGSEFTKDRGNEEAHITCPDFVAYCAMLGEFGHFEEAKIAIECQGSHFGASWFDQKGFSVDMFHLDDAEAATEYLIDLLAWN
jgi:inosine-uridine nucleoside N-ribohydrolase